VVAGLVSLPRVMWGPLRVTREDPARALLTDARAPVGSLISFSSEWGWVLASDSGCSGIIRLGTIRGGVNGRLHGRDKVSRDAESPLS
jgi:hypothetical protein